MHKLPQCTIVTRSIVFLWIFPVTILKMFFRIRGIRLFSVVDKTAAFLYHFSNIIPIIQFAFRGEKRAPRFRLDSFLFLRRIAANLTEELFNRVWRTSVRRRTRRGRRGKNEWGKTRASTQRRIKGRGRSRLTVWIKGNDEVAKFARNYPNLFLYFEQSSCRPAKRFPACFGAMVYKKRKETFPTEDFHLERSLAKPLGLCYREQ